MSPCFGEVFHQFEYQIIINKIILVDIIHNQFILCLYLIHVVEIIIIIIFIDKKIL